MTLHLTPTIEGSERGETLLFVQGWPDDASTWDATVAALKDRYRCARVTLPNYGGDRSERWGFVTEEIVEALVAVIDELAAEKPLTLVLHDWGCYWGHVAHHRRPDRVARVAGVDVAPHYTPSPGAGLGIVVYQSWLYGAFVVGGPVGDWMTRQMAKVAGAPRKSGIHAWMNYPYRNIWADIFSGRGAKLTKGYWPTCPLLFVYGEKKPFHFHSKAWIDHVRKTGGEVVGLPSNHWATHDPGFVDVLSRWLEKTS